MQKLIIKETFLGVQPCEIEFDRFLLLIGEQASGKSTIAKLIYFFQSVPEILYNFTILNALAKKEYNEIEFFRFPILFQIFDLFGIDDVKVDFCIEFHYNNDTFITISKRKNQNGSISWPIETNAQIKKPIEKFLQTTNEINPSTIKISTQQELLFSINDIFKRKTTNETFIIAGRNNVVAYSEYFETKVNAEVEKLRLEQIKGQDLERKLKSGNENLLLRFVEWSSSVRKHFQKNGGTFENVKEHLMNEYSIEKFINYSKLEIFEKIFAKILKAEYKHDSNGEFLKINENESVYMKDASSEQQEVLRILQGLFLSVGLKNRREFFVVEEPEAHLYPLAQKELINAFALFLNTIRDGRLIITTHSPYILACVNILLYAHYVSKQATENVAEISKSVQKDFWLDSKIFNAYSLGHQGNYCQNIKDVETGLIDQNYLDAISEALGMQFHQLHNLLFETYA